MSTLVSVEELRTELAKGSRPQMIDVRTPSEFAGGHIPCATNIPMDQFEARRKDLRLEDGVVLVCKAGGRAQMVADWLDGQSGDTLREVDSGLYFPMAGEQVFGG